MTTFKFGVYKLLVEEIRKSDSIRFLNWYAKEIKEILK
jgi:hypothetical protein